MILYYITAGLGLVQLAGWLVALLSLVFERGEDPRFAGDKWRYRS